MSDPYVMQAQNLLNAHGYDCGPADGIPGPRLVRCITRALEGDIGGNGSTRPYEQQPSNGEITERVAMELVGHEAIVPEAYKDSVGVWTWGIGVTSASGHSVERYKDNPQTIQRCLEVYIWLLREKYAPGVVKAFEGHALTEAQFGAALSFHYNTGAIGKASWVDSWKAGKQTTARHEFMNWRKPPEIIERREKERDLFFDGKWSQDGKATVYEVAKPSYSPRWSSAKRIDISADLKAALAAS